MLETGYWIIPNTVLYSTELSDKQKLLFCVISNLCAEKGYCRASNEYIGNLLNADKWTISKNITKLYEKWFIVVEIDNKDSQNSKRKITLEGIVKNDHTPSQKWVGGIVKNDYLILQENNTIEKKEINKEKKAIPSVSELVDEYEKNEVLVKKLWDTSLVKERAEYKQSKKDRAYKTTSGFIQQLSVCIETVRFNSPRWDTATRFRFALNQAMERQWKSMYWTDQTENEYQAWKKTLTLTL